MYDLVQISTAQPCLRKIGDDVLGSLEGEAVTTSDRQSTIAVA